MLSGKLRSMRIGTLQLVDKDSGVRYDRVLPN